MSMHKDGVDADSGFENRMEDRDTPAKRKRSA